MIIRSRLYAVLFLLLSGCGESSLQVGVNTGLPPDPEPVCNANGMGEPGQTAVGLQRVFPDLSFSQPLAMLQAPGDGSRWFVVERAGRVRVFANQTGVSSFQPDFIDIRTQVDTSGEGGLLGMAFHPDYGSNGQVFLSFTETGAPLVSRIVRYTTVSGGSTLDPTSATEVLRLNQDFGNHNGGHIGFGPDGHLYIGFGDGGSAGDPNGRAQDTTNLLGAFLRLDVDGGSPYAIPADNPFAGNSLCGPDPNVSANDCPEILAWGLRNPWRWSFDTTTGILWAGDVGQSDWEEIDQVIRGGNYGWDIREGAHCYEPPGGCSTAGLIDPVAEYDHGLGSSITGGHVYRGSVLPGLAGRYLFGDFGSGRIWCLAGDAADGFVLDQLQDTDLSIVSFGRDVEGELYVIDIAGGLYRIIER